MDDYRKYREILAEAVAESSDDLIEKFLEEGDLSNDEIKNGVRRLTIENKIILLCCGTAFKNKGVQPLLDYVDFFLPSPKDLPDIEGVKVDSEEPDFRKSR